MMVPRFLAVVLALVASTGSAQPNAGVRHSLVGRVVDADSGLPLPGAAVRVLDRGTTTDADGRFSIAGVPADTAVVAVTFVGYAPWREMVDLVVIDGKARGIIARNLITGELERHTADAVVLASGGYGRVYFLSTNAWNSNGSAAWRCHRRGAAFANPCYVQIHPTCIPVKGEQQSKLTLMSESLRNDGRVWVPKTRQDSVKDAHKVPEKERDYYLERRYPSFGNLVPRDVASRNAKMMTDKGLGVGPEPQRLAVFLDFESAINRLGKDQISERYGNLFDIYHEITDENPYEVPMKIYPAVHYTMGGLWVDYNLMTTIPGLYAIGEANFSDHGANRLGASALMQGLCDGYFVLPYTIGDDLARGIQRGR